MAYELIRTKRVYDGKMVSVRVDTVTQPDGSPVSTSGPSMR